MKRKIIGIFIITLLTLSYMPIITSEESQVSESYEREGGNIFFMGRIYGHREFTKKSSVLFFTFNIPQYRNK